MNELGDMRSGGNCQYLPVTVDEEKIAARAFERYEARYPESFRKSSDYLKSHLNEDLRSHVRYMKESLAIDDPAIFLDYVSWLQVLFIWLHFPGDALEATLEVFSEVLLEELPEEKGVKASQYIAQARALISASPHEIPSFIQENNPLAAPARAYLTALLATNQEAARVILMEQLDRGVPVHDLYRALFQPVLQETGRLWQIQQVSVAQEHYITEVTRLFIALLHERMKKESRIQKRKGRLLVATCVSDELHDVGIRMVANFFEMDGWDTLYTGANTPAPSIVAMIQDRHADAIAISTTMPFHIPRVYELIRAIRANPGTAGTRIIVGGYPFNLVPGLWKCVGADAGAVSADEAVEKVNRLISA
jgi:methanogenic corrinoid protein MtbC1